MLSCTVLNCSVFFIQYCTAVSVTRSDYQELRYSGVQCSVTSSEYLWYLTRLSFNPAVFAVRGSLHVPFEGAYVSQSKTLSWICNNTKKMKPSLLGTSSTTTTAFDATVSIPNEAVTQKQAPLPGKFSYAAAASKLSTSSQLPPTAVAVKGSKTASPAAKKSAEDSDVECWTLTSTREFGAANKVK
jgi:hypothetical protein